MKQSNSRAEIIRRRGELLAELLLQDLNAEFISRADKEQGQKHDFFVGFLNSKSGINTFAVQVKATEQSLTTSRFAISKDQFNHLAYSNVPALLIVVDVKRNRLYYAWLTPEHEETRRNTVLVSLTEISDKTTAVLKTQLTRVYGGHAVAG